MIFTFYSYKGGVGRSMALANVAACFEKAGLRVAMIDWDLEAPGIESYFVSNADELRELRSSIGLIDVLTSYRRTFSNLEFSPHDSDSAHESIEKDVQALERQLSPLSHALYPLRGSSNPSLLLLHAGWRTGSRFKSYAEAVQSFDWTEFYAHYRGEAYFEWMRRQLLKGDVADIVLIDSRTGVTEMGGVCTRQLADVVVCFSVMNQQNLQGCMEMAASFSRTDLLERRGRPLQSVFVPARVDSFNTKLKNQLQSEFTERFSQYMPPLLRAVKAQFWDLRIPYISDYAYRERLAVGDPQSDKDLEDSYRKIAAHLAMLAPPATNLKVRYSSEIRRIFGSQLPDVVVVHQSGVPRATALDLVERLQSASLSVWPEPVMTTGTVSAELHSAIAQARLVVAFGGEDAVQSGWLRSVWWAARERGLPIFPVRQEDHSAPASAEVPNWMRQVPMLEVPRQWPDLLSRLREPYVQLRLLSMAPPLSTPRLVHRHESDTLVAALCQGADATLPKTIVLWGLAGAGKSTLAASVSRDARVQDAFPDGVMWVSLGAKPDIPSELRRCLLACGRSPPAQALVPDLRRELELQLRLRQCLLVIDEAYDVEHVRVFQAAGAGSAQIVTTRFRSLAYAIDGTAMAVGDLSSREAYELVTHRIDSTPSAGGNGTAAELVDSLVRKVGGSALAVNLINRELQSRTDQGQKWTAALTELADSIEKVGLGALDHSTSKVGAESIQNSIGSSFERLSGEDRDRLFELAEQSASSRTSLRTFAERLRQSPENLRGWLEEMADSALVEFDHGMETVSVHPLVQLFLKDRSREARESQAGAHGVSGAFEPAGASAAPDRAAEASLEGLPAVARGSVPSSVTQGPGFDEHRNALPPASAQRMPSAEIAYAPNRKRLPIWAVALLGLLSIMLLPLAWLAMRMPRPPPPMAETVSGASTELPAQDGLPAAPSARLSANAELGQARLAEQHLRFAERTRAAGEYYTALEQYREAVALNPKDQSAWFGQANVELALGQIENALRTFGQLLEGSAGPGNSGGRTAAGRELIVLSHLGRATALGERAARGGAGPIDLARGDGKLALAEVDKAEAIDPGSSAVQLARAGLLERANRKREAASAYSRAIELDPERADAYFQRGRLYQEIAEANPTQSTSERQLAMADFRRVLSMSRAEPMTAQAARARLAQLGERSAPPQPPTTVYIHYASQADAPLVEAVRARLEGDGVIAPAPELTEGRVAAASLRYFFAENQDEARFVKATVEAALAANGIKLPVPTQYRSIEQFPSAKPQRLELWLPPLTEPLRMFFAPQSRN